MRTSEPRSTVWVRGQTKNVTPSPPPLQTVERGSTVRTLCVNGPQGARSARGWHLQCHPLFLTLLNCFLCESDSCVGLILVQGSFLCGADRGH